MTDFADRAAKEISEAMYRDGALRRRNRDELTEFAAIIRRHAVEKPEPFRGAGSSQHIGNGVYVDSDGKSLTLFTTGGYDDSSTIHLEPEVYRALVAYVVELLRSTRRDDDPCDGAG
jgi:hypothetical protein